MKPILAATDLSVHSIGAAGRVGVRAQSDKAAVMRVHAVDADGPHPLADTGLFEGRKIQTDLTVDVLAAPSFHHSLDSDRE